MGHAERPHNRRMACGRALTYNGHCHSSLRHVGPRLIILGHPVT